DRACVFDAGQVLDRSRDADGDVELRCDDLAGLANLQLVRRESGVDRGPRSTDGRAEQRGELFDALEVVRTAEPASASYDAPRRLQIGPIAGRHRLRHEARVRRQRSSGPHTFDGRARLTGPDGLERR